MSRPRLGSMLHWGLNWSPCWHICTCALPECHNLQSYTSEQACLAADHGYSSRLRLYHVDPTIDHESIRTDSAYLRLDLTHCSGQPQELRCCS